MDRDQLALIEQHVSRAALAAAELGHLIIGAHQQEGESASDIGLLRRQGDQRVAAASRVTKAELSVAGRRAQRRRWGADRLLHDRVVTERDLVALGTAPGAFK